MNKRWVSIGVLAGALFAINVVARLITRLGFPDNETAETRVTLASFTAIGVILAVLTFLRSQRSPVATWLPDLAAAAALGMLLTILIGPFVSGDYPFSSGAGNFFSQIWLYAGFAIVGTLLGYWIATMLGRDYRSRSLKAYTQRRVAKPRRIVRR